MNIKDLKNINDDYNQTHQQNLEIIDKIKNSVKSKYGKKLSKKSKSSFEAMWEENLNVFSRNRYETGIINEGDFKLELINPNCKPVSMSAKTNLPETELAEIDRQVEELCKNGQCSPHNTSEWSFQCRLVDKEDGKKRLIINYIPLNIRCKKISGHVPIIDNLLKKFEGKKVFTKLDITSAYHHCRVTDKKTKDLLTFITRKGTYTWNVLNFGTSNAPKFFNKILYKILGYKKNVIQYFDDIIIASENIEEHIKDVSDILKTCMQIILN